MEEKRENQQKILIVDDSQINREILADMLGDEYSILEASNGMKAVELLQQHSQDLDLVLLDIIMPEMDGFDVLTVMNKYHWIADIPVIMISTENSPAYVERAFELGVSDYISRPFDTLVVRRRVVNTLMLYAKQKKLVGMVSDQIYEKEKKSSMMVNILGHIVEFRNGESGQHVLHMNIMSMMLLQRLIQKTDEYQLTNSDIALISTASALHDIGKIAISSEILNKPGRLTPEEFQVMKTHAAIGASMLRDLPLYQRDALVKVAYQICRWHHERYDGNGYPDGLKGEEIPISAQVVSLVDVYDALTSRRVYKPAFSHEKAMEMILNGECGAFNPLLLECLVDVADQLRQELERDQSDRGSYMELHNIADELLNHKELSSTERTLQMLEREHAKRQFFADHVHEIHFEYTWDPDIFAVSDWGAEYLGVRPIILEPFEDPQFSSLMTPEDWEEFRKKVHEVTPGNSEVQLECTLQVKGKAIPCRMICRIMWALGGSQRMVSVVGKAIPQDLQE